LGEACPAGAGVEPAPGPPGISSSARAGGHPSACTEKERAWSGSSAGWQEPPGSALPSLDKKNKTDTLLVGGARRRVESQVQVAFHNGCHAQPVRTRRSGHRACDGRAQPPCPCPTT